MPKELEHKIVPFVSVKDAPGYLKFLSEVLGAEPVTDAVKGTSGKVKTRLKALESIEYWGKGGNDIVRAGKQMEAL